jgi:carboxylesterase type B
MGARPAFSRLASALLCLALAGGAAVAQTASDPAAPGAVRALCEASAPRKQPLTDAEAAACRALFQEDVAAARARQEAFQQKALADLAARKTHPGPQPQGPVPLSSFVGESTLDYGDIVIIDDGPRVYVGRPYEIATAEDFVMLDASRSPHRKRAKAMLKALKQ